MNNLVKTKNTPNSQRFYPENIKNCQINDLIKNIIPTNSKHDVAGVVTTQIRLKDKNGNEINIRQKQCVLNLDKNTKGLLLLTNDGDIVNKLLRAENGHEKEYVVRVDKKIDNTFKSKMENGLPVDGQITLPCTVDITGPHTFKIILKQGLNRQIRKMCEQLGYRVVKLKRIRFMNILLGDLKVGAHRFLTKDEIRKLKAD